MAEHNKLGSWGEKIACEYLITNGYAIVEQNKNIGRKEIDIIATKGNRICFIEVKTRSNESADPFDAIDERRQRRMCQAADSYIRDFNVMHEPQYDIIAITGSPENGHKLSHIPDAFFPPLKSF